MRARTFLIQPSPNVPIFYSTIIGGTTATAVLTLQSTSGVGTTDEIDLVGGNNGATKWVTVTSGQTTINAAGSNRFRVQAGSGGTTGMIAGSLGSNRAAFWVNAVTPSDSNSMINSDGSDVYLNAAASGDTIYITNAGNNNYSFRRGLYFAPSADATSELGQASTKRWLTVYTMTASFGVKTTSAVTNVNGFAGYLSCLDNAGNVIKLAVLT